MRVVEIAEYKVTEPTSWLLIAMGLAVSLMRIWDSLRFGLNPAIAWAASISAIVGLAVSHGLKRKSSIVVETQTLAVETSLFGREVRRREKNLSDAAWVRARLIGNYQNQIAVEVGTVGYTTTELVRLPHKYGNSKSISEAEVLCARVAANLNIPNKGFKDLA